MAAHAVMALALYALLVHVFTLDALAINRSAHLATTAICAVDGSTGQQPSPAGNSHADCALMCQSGACGASAPAPLPADVQLAPESATVISFLPMQAWLADCSTSLFEARGPPVSG